MYINSPYSITNTPSNQSAAYNTWPYYTKAWYQSVPQYYIDEKGNRVEWNHWNPPQMVAVSGGMYKGTPTRTGGFYAQNYVPIPKQNLGGCCNVWN